jgi:hypothetical protein
MHRSPKRWYRRSSKRNPRKEVVRHERRVARIRKLRNELRSRNKVDPKIVEEQKLGAKAADIHHFIGTNQNTPVSLNSFRVPSPDCSVRSEDLGTSPDPLGKVDPQLCWPRGYTMLIIMGRI